MGGLARRAQQGQPLGRDDALKARETLAIFNRGLVSRRALARVDVGRVTLSAEQQTNWIPRVLGSMSLRPGTEHHGSTRGDATGIYVPFVFAFDDSALLEMTNGAMRVWDDGDTLVARNAVSASITNGTFGTDLAGWTDADETGATSAWATGGYMSLTGTRYLEARRRQSISITEENTVHGLRVIVQRGPVLIRIGTTAGDDDVFTQAVLRTGTHSLAFTPGAATIHIELASSRDYPVLVDSVAFDVAGTLEMPTPWTGDHLQALRWQQVGDLVFVACDGLQQRRIERRDNNSWSVVLYETNDGPFVGPNTDGTRLTPSAIAGEITLTSSRSLFNSTSVGQIFRLTSQGQKVEASISAEGTFSDSIKITGVTSSRDITVARTGTWSATISLQRSIGEEGSWVTVATYTTNASITYNDALDNTIAFYRIGIETGNYTSGTAELSLTAVIGSITGVVRVITHVSATEVNAVVLSALGGTDATEVWEAGSWNGVDGYPTAVALYEGRLWWAGRGRIWGSVADAFDSFDPDFEGDAGPINRSVGDGAVDAINWLLPVQRLIAGSGTAEHSIRSTTFDEPVTPTNFNVKEASTQGSKAAPVVRYDSRGVFVHRCGSRLYEIEYDLQKADYASLDLTALVPELGEAGFSRIAVQRQPDTRIYAVRDDGTIALMVRDPAEDVLAWVELETDGDVVDIAVLPGTIEDRVFWIVKREVNGSTVRFHEEMARVDQCRGGTVNRQADAAVLYSGAATSTLTGYDHLEGKAVVVWGGGADLGTFTVSGGEVDLGDVEVSDAWGGLGYRARYKSSKLAAETQLGLSLTQRRRIDHLGLILADTHAQGLKYGGDFETMDELPLVEKGVAIDTASVWDSYDNDMISFNGEWTTDARLCLEANAPRPCTVMAAVLNVDTQSKATGSAR